MRCLYLSQYAVSQAQQIETAYTHPAVFFDSPLINPRHSRWKACRYSGSWTRNMN